MTFSPATTNDPTIDRNLDAIARALVDADRKLLGQNFSLVQATLATTDTPVDHKLDRPPLGWIVVRSNTHATYRDGTASATPKRTINLRASASASVTVLFF